MNEFFFTPLAGMPFIIWIIAFEYYVLGYLPNWLWGFWFFRYLWNPDYMKEVIGEELYDKLS